MIESDEPIRTVLRLLEPHDRQFINASYSALLGRAPDPEGERYYLNKLRNGVHKLSILRELRRSAEGQKFIPGVAGLDAAIKRHQSANVAVVGGIVRLLTGEEGDSSSDRRVRALANEIGRIRNELSDGRVDAADPSAFSKGHAHQPDMLPDQVAAHSSIQAVRFQPTFVPNAQGRYQLEEFLQLHDSRFVHAAYLAILQREADPSGHEHYVRTVRAGRSKVNILRDLRNSNEGKARGVVIEGLGTAFLIDRVLEAPIIGAVLHFLLFSVTIKSHLRTLRALENHVIRLAEEGHAIHCQKINRLEQIVKAQA